MALWCGFILFCDVIKYIARETENTEGVSGWEGRTTSGATRREYVQPTWQRYHVISARLVGLGPPLSPFPPPRSRGRDKLIGIYCTQTPINWNCKRCLYLELQFLRIANPRIAIPKNCNSQNCNTLAFIAV